MTEEVKNEIDAMMKALGNPVPEPEKVEAKKEEPKPEPEPKKEEVKDEPKPEPEPKKEEPELDEKDKIIADLRTKLAEKDTKPPEKEPDKKESEKKEEPPAEADFVGELDLDELTRDPKEFNKVLNKVYQKASEDVRKGILTEIPEVVRTNVAIVEALRKTTEKFYDENQDLKPFKKVVATVFEEVASKSSDKSYDDVVKEVATEVRKRLDLPKKEEIKDEKKSDPPKLPRAGGKAGRSQDEPKINPLQAELEEMNKSLGR